MRRMVLAAAVGVWGWVAAGISPVTPFVAVTGTPGPEEAAAKVRRLKQAGYGQFLVYARSGLQHRYMGEEWLAASEAFCSEAEKLGMKVWLYDEYNWPSGTCRGRVPAEREEWRYCEMGVHRKEGGGYEWRKALAPHGWVNVCEYGAVKRFIELTHDVYAKRLARWLKNGTVVGIFTDEPGHPVGVHHEGSPVKKFRWFTGLEDDYREATGRDFRRDVEEWLDAREKAGREIPEDPRSAVWPAYAKVLGRRFRKAYFDQVRAKCDEMGILLTGHLISEDNLRDSCVCNGDPMEVLKGASLPGMDEIVTRTGSRNAEWLTLHLTQYAAKRNGRGGLAELFGIGPNDMTPARMRQMFWLEAMHGVDNYLVAMDVVDMRGLVEKHGYLAPVHEGQSWTVHMRELLEEGKKAAKFARNLEWEHEVAVRYPQTLAALATYAGGKTPDVKAALREFKTRQVDFDFIAEGDETDRKMVFSFLPDGKLREERSGKTFETGSGAAAAWALGRIDARLKVLESDGRMARDVIVRNYCDGTSVILNLQSESDRALTAVAGGRKVEFLLPARGVEALGKGEMPEAAKACGKTRMDRVVWEVGMSAPNVWRVNFDTNKVGRLKVTAPLKGVRFALRELALSYAVTATGRPVDSFEGAAKGEKVLRHEAAPYAFELDGKRLEAAGPCTVLRAGYNELYRESAPVDLEPGEHVLRIVSGEADQNYFLPAAFAAGDFGVYGGALGVRRKKVKACGLTEAGLGTYPGEATYSAVVEVPKGKGLRLGADTGGLFGAVKLGGADLGARGWEPFEWEVPEGLQGRKLRLEVSVYPPAVTMLGDADAEVAKWDAKMWVKPRTEEYRGGVYGVWWRADVFE